jgi:rare lipoprotein A
MRSFFAAVLAAFALVGGASLPAEAFSGVGSRAAHNHDGMRSQHVQRTRAAIGNDGGARPTHRSRMEGRLERPRYSKPRRVRSAKGTWVRTSRHAAKQGRIARRSVQRTSRTGARMVGRPAAQQAVASPGSTGVASFYGGRFHGRLTASGVRFDANGMTAAHRSLPFGTRVRVTHLGNGRSVDVRINDRGPYVGGRIIDLSQGAAGAIGMHGQGVARVKVTVLGR